MDMPVPYIRLCCTSATRILAFYSHAMSEIQFISWSSKHNKKDMLDINHGRGGKVKKDR
jgi:hypothetical protein